MHRGGFRRWLLLPGALAAATLLGTGCERDQSSLPRTGGQYEGVANEQQPTESFVPGDQPEQPQQGGQPDTGSDRPATGGSGHDTEDQGAQTSPDEFRRPQQRAPEGQMNSPSGLSAPGFTTPNEQPTDQGGTRRWEEQSGTTNKVDGLDQDRGPRSPPEIDTEQQPQ